MLSLSSRRPIACVVRVVSLAVVLSTSAPAFADEPSPVVVAPPPPPPLTLVVDRPREPEHVLSLTFSPLNLILPEVKVMAEIRLARKVSVAAIGGVGSVGVSSDGSLAIGAGAAERFVAWEAGAQGRYYLVGSFEHGMDVGLQAEYVGLSGSKSASGVEVLGTGSGFLAGPFVGYKLATRVGFTLDLQGGIAYEVVAAEASGGGRSASGSASAWAPIVNLNLGWSF